MVSGLFEKKRDAIPPHPVPPKALRILHAGLPWNRALSDLRTRFKKGNIGTFSLKIGNTAEAWPCCSTRSDGDMLRAWFSCHPFVPREHGVNMTAALEICIKEQATCNSGFFFFGQKEWKGQRSIDNCLPRMDRTVCHNDVCTNGSKYLKATEPVLLMQTGKDAHPRTKHGACESNNSWKLWGNHWGNCCKTGH
jgi:hypothetical protein